MEDIAKNYTHIKGWGIDADPKNEPTYPMKKWTGDDHARLNYERPPQQPVNIEILHSNERPNITAVFGTVSPPSGLSGMIRRFAFKSSENSYAHWLPLLIADRVNAVEGIIDDLKHGYVPNIFAERGMAAAWKYDRKAFVKNAAAGIIVTAAVVALLAGANKISSTKPAKRTRKKLQH